MSLTQSHGPLAGSPPESVNYQIDGPAHRLYFERFPRRVRAIVAGETLVDTREGNLLHETGLLPQLYIPATDVRPELLEPSGHTTHCPFKGDARYWSIRTGERRVENAVWAYPDPLPAAAWLNDHLALYWDAADTWLDEDEQVSGHLRDPYHRVDVRESRRNVSVLLDGRPIASTARPMLLSETGLPNRYYIPPQDVDDGVLSPSETRSVCPYKGTASYWNLQLNGRRLDDAAWSYPEPLEEATRVGGHLSFEHDGLTLEVDGRPID
jgi:uncharacterized protein (DUF427 family)